MQCCFILAIYAYFIFFCQHGYSQKMTVESDDIPYEYIYHLNMTTNSIENCEYCDTTICKDSYCFNADRDFGRPFIEIPITANTSRLNDNNTDCEKCKRLETKVYRYILHPYVGYTDPFITDKISTDCTKDAQCFTNKCVNNTCTFNENNIITRCRYDRCGRFLRDPCVKNDDCSEGYCDGVCTPDPPEESHEGEGLTHFFYLVGFLCVFAILSLCAGCCCVGSIFYENDFKKTKSDNTKSSKEFNNI